MTSLAVDFADVRAAVARLAGRINPTPVMTCQTLNALTGRSLFFKCEQFQKAGAFKFRGACNAVSALSEQQALRGVATHSSGNHGQSLALAAKQRGIAAHIVMPVNAPIVKRQAVEHYGGRIIDCRPTHADREKTAKQVSCDTGAVLIHPYDNRNVIAGQATAAMELIDEVGELDAIVAPVGGGGLLSGVCIAVKHQSPHCRIIGAEPAGADDAARSFAAGRIIPSQAPDTIADGLRTSLGELTWPIIRQHVDRMITVSDQQIITAMRDAWRYGKWLIEPSAAVALAAVLTDECKSLADANRVGVILSGGNVDLDRLPWMT